VENLAAFHTAINTRAASDTLIYVCADVQQLASSSSGPLVGRKVLVVRELSENYEEGQYAVVGVKEVPIHIEDIGVYFQQAFPEKDYFSRITSEHRFQSLTESNKPGTAFRTGIYLTRVTPIDNNPDVLKFHLLRCSSNLNGPSDNFRATDEEVVGRVNELAAAFFKSRTDMNHVLAQVYENRHVTAEDGSVKQRKAKIKDHSDKTKDMDPRGLIAFVTFYRTEDGRPTNNPNVLTKLRFRRKRGKTHIVNIVLHPNSVLLISLATNRLYTHEIIPSSLSIDEIPTRLGYVVRCSNAPAVFKNGQTYIEVNDIDGTHYVPMAAADEKGVRQLRDLYFAENSTNEVIYYPDIHFSMNNGDYCKPIL
jgi:hypothetical protein